MCHAHDSSMHIPAYVVFNVRAYSLNVEECNVMSFNVARQCNDVM